MDVKKNIRKHREKNGFTQEYVATQMGLTQQAYQQMESGPTKLDAELMPELAALLGTTVTELYEDKAAERSDSMEPTKQQLYDMLVAAQAKVIKLQDEKIENGKGRRK